MMNIVLSGAHGEAEASFKVPGHRVVSSDDLLLYSLEIGNAAGYWVEFSRALISGQLSRRTEQMRAAYPEAMEAARLRLREGELASNVHRAITEVLARHGFSLGHLSGHAIGTTMLEYPSIGAASDVTLKENMISLFILKSWARTAKSASTRKTPSASARPKARICATWNGASTAAATRKLKRYRYDW